MDEKPKKDIATACAGGSISGADSAVCFTGGDCVHAQREKAVDQAVHRLKIEMGTRITDHLTRFLEILHQINQANVAALGNGLLDARNQAALAAFNENPKGFERVETA